MASRCATAVYLCQVCHRAARASAGSAALNAFVIARADSLHKLCESGTAFACQRRGEVSRTRKSGAPRLSRVRAGAVLHGFRLTRSESGTHPVDDAFDFEQRRRV